MAPASCYHIENRVQALYPYSDGCMTAVMRKHLHLYIMEKWVHIGLIGYEVSLRSTTHSSTGCNSLHILYNCRLWASY